MLATDFACRSLGLRNHTQALGIVVSRRSRHVGIFCRGCGTPHRWVPAAMRRQLERQLLLWPEPRIKPEAGEAMRRRLQPTALHLEKTSLSVDTWNSSPACTLLVCLSRLPFQRGQRGQDIAPLSAPRPQGGAAIFMWPGRHGRVSAARRRRVLGEPRLHNKYDTRTLRGSPQRPLSGVNQTN